MLPLAMPAIVIGLDLDMARVAGPHPRHPSSAGYRLRGGFHPAGLWSTKERAGARIGPGG
jgi:hypothetical protein